MIEEIIKRSLTKMKEDIKEIEGIERIDFVDIFPISPQHKEALDKEAHQLGIVLVETERGIVYKLKKPIPTIYGELSILKIRFFDETRLPWEAAYDFQIKNRSLLERKVGIDSRFSYTKRPEWDAVEFKTTNS